MSKERKMNELIESLNKEESDRAWAQIQEKIKQMEESGELPVCNVKPKPSVSVKKITSLCVSLALVIGVGTFAALHFGNNGGGPVEKYCDCTQYKIQQTEVTLKEYSQQTGKGLLYLDWYDQLETEDYVYYLNDSEEVICYQEKVEDTIISGSIVTVYVTDTYICLDVLDNYNDITDWNSQAIGETITYYKNDKEVSFSMFEYKGYRYYIQLEFPTDDTHILQIVDEMLP